MIPQTDLTDPVFLAERPDYAQQVLIDRNYQVQIFASEDATEQRRQQRQFSKIGISYKVAALNPWEAFAREIAILKELNSPIVVPLWPYSFAITAQATVTLTTGSLAGVPFRPGGWVFVEDDNGEAFYPLATWNPAGSLVLSGTVPTFSNGLVRPCIIGTRRDGTTDFTTNHTETTEDVAIDEL